MKVTVLPDQINRIASGMLVQKGVALRPDDCQATAAVVVSLHVSEAKKSVMEQDVKPLKILMSDGKTGRTTLASLASTKVYILRNGYII